MKTKTVLSKIAPPAVLALVLGALAFSTGHGHRRGSIAGAWINTDQIPGDPNTVVQSQILTPLDPAGASFVAIVDSPNPVQNAADHTFGRPTGTYVRVGPGRYAFTLIFHRGRGPTEFPGRAAYVSLAVFSGTAYLSDADTLVNDGVMAVFPASQGFRPPFSRGRMSRSAWTCRSLIRCRSGWSRPSPAKTDHQEAKTQL